jgi:hypothetical protein
MGLAVEVVVAEKQLEEVRASVGRQLAQLQRQALKPGFVVLRVDKRTQRERRPRLEHLLHSGLLLDRLQHPLVLLKCITSTREAELQGVQQRPSDRRALPSDRRALLRSEQLLHLPRLQAKRKSPVDQVLQRCRRTDRL